MNEKHIGSTLESLFDELGEREEFEALLEKKLAEKGYIGLEAVAAALSVTRKGINLLISEGLPVAMTGSKQYFDLQAVLEWMKANPHVRRIHSTKGDRRRITSRGL